MQRILFRFRSAPLLAFATTLVLACSLSTRCSGAGIGLKAIAEGFTSPTLLVPLDNEGRLLIGDQIGTLQVLGKDGKLQPKPFLDLRGRLAKLNQGFDERGLLGVALHPKFRENRKLFVYYSAPRRQEAPEKWDHTSHLSEFTASADLSQADLASERVVMQIDQPQFNHNCGRMEFGPDGYLYLGTGDGGAGNDMGLGHSAQGNGQDTTTLLGKILRIDVDSRQPYGIPKDNPFADGAKGRPEIYAYGLRNPWGISFDRGGKRELFVADVGQDSFEEVNIVTKGGNYGWRIREAYSCFDPKKPLNPPDECPKVGAMGEPLIDPILAYKNFKRFPKDPEAKGISITGGYVYRGKALPQLVGKYVFADWSRAWVAPDGVLYVASPDGSGKWKMESLEVGSKLAAYVLAFGQDAEGELYVLVNGRNALTGNTGKVLKLVPM